MIFLLACTGPVKDPEVLDTAFEETAPDPYACGWERGDPGTLEATGSELGDVVADLSGIDQCGDEYHLWDGHGSHTVLLAPVFW